MKYYYPLYLLRHPIQGFEELKYQQIFSYIPAGIIVFFILISDIFKYFLTGFGYNMNNLQSYNILFAISRTVFLFFLWCVSNWLICTLMEGKGRFKEIFAASAYALVPYIIITFITTILSKAVVSSEMMLVQWLSVLGVLWSISMMIIALMSIHEYTISKAIIASLLTISGIVVILFLLALSFSIYQQVFVMFRSIFNEIVLRMS